MNGRFTSFVFGGLIGLAIGILYAPKSGQETREELRTKADEYLDQGLQNIDVQKERFIEAVETGRKSALEKSEELKDKIENTRDRLKEQVDAAAETARDKINVAAKKVQDMSDSGETEATEEK